MDLVETFTTRACEVSYCVFTYGGVIAIVSTRIAFVDIFTYSFRSFVITVWADTLTQAINVSAVRRIYSIVRENNNGEIGTVARALPSDQLMWPV